MSGWDILLLALLAAAVGLAVRRMVKDHRAGRTCCGDCASCGGACAVRSGGTKG